jgi:hypothetical protein
LILRYTIMAVVFLDSCRFCFTKCWGKISHPKLIVAIIPQSILLITWY